MASSCSTTSSGTASPSLNKADCPFSVEVEASSPDSLRLSQKGWSLALYRRESITATADCWDDQYATPVALVPVGSSSESDDSCSVQHEADDDEDELLATRSSQPPPPPSPMDDGHNIVSPSLDEADCCMGIASNNTLVLIKTDDKQSGNCRGNEQDAMGVYDCLADQITNLFCPVDHHKNVSGGAQETNSVSAASLSSASSQQIGIITCGPDLDHLFTSHQGDDNLFTAAFNFWLTPSQEELIRKQQQQQLPRPRNRSSASNRRRARHVQRLCDTWYPPTEQQTPSFVLQRSKSFNTLQYRSIQLKQQPSVKIVSSGNSSSDDFYDSDPEQEYRHKQQRKVTLLTLNPNATPRRSSSSNSSQSSSKSHFRRFQPASIDCTHESSDRYGGRFNVMAGRSDSTCTHNSVGQLIQPNNAAQPTFTMNDASDDVGSSSYETANADFSPHPTASVTMEDSEHRHNLPTLNPLIPPVAPRNSDRYSFDYESMQLAGETSAEQQQDEPPSLVSQADEPYQRAPTRVENHHRESCGEISSLESTHHPTIHTSLAVGQFTTTEEESASISVPQQHQQEQTQRQKLRVETFASASSYTSVGSSTTTISTATTTTSVSVGGGGGATAGGGTIISHIARNCPAYFQSPTHWTEFHLLYSNADDVTKAYVQELSNVRFPLIWHPRGELKSGKSGCKCPSTTDPSPSSSATTIASSHSHPCSTISPAPMAVHGVFEVGAHLEHMVVQPKFTWSPIVQPDLQDKRRIVLNESQPNSVELLSIIRVNKPNGSTMSTLPVDDNSCTIDRRLYPFARLDRTVCITTNDVLHPQLVLEAPSRAERDWLVVALKLIVARLASIIIVRDEEMLLEFFSPYSALMQLEADDIVGASLSTPTPDATTMPSETAPAATGIPGMPPTQSHGIRRRQNRRTLQLRKRRHRPQQQHSNDGHSLNNDAVLTRSEYESTIDSTAIIASKYDYELVNSDTVEQCHERDYFTEKGEEIEEMAEEVYFDDETLGTITDDDEGVLNHVEDDFVCHHDHPLAVDDTDDDDGDHDIDNCVGEIETRQGPPSASTVGGINNPTTGTTLDPTT